MFGAARASKTGVVPIPASARISAPPRDGQVLATVVEYSAAAWCPTASRSAPTRTRRGASGYDLRTGQPKGTLKENGVRFYVKVTNVPKDLSIAAEAWDDVSAALDAAMDRAGAEMGR